MKNVSFFSIIYHDKPFYDDKAFLINKTIYAYKTIYPKQHRNKNARVKAKEKNMN